MLRANFEIDNVQNFGSRRYVRCRYIVQRVATVYL